MKTSKIHILLVLFFLPTFVFSQEVAEKTSNDVAKNFFYEKSNINKSVQYNDIELNLKQTLSKKGNVIYRIYEPQKQSGFVIVSANENTIPILGYSTENRFETNKEFPPNVKEWLDSYVLQIEATINSQNKTINPLWNTYSKKPDISQTKSTKDVAPLLSTTWHQGCGYNSLCPEDASGQCGHVWAGCVATAMAQIMKYHEHPVNGEDTFSYTNSYGYQFADFENTTYDWANMPNGSGNTNVAELIYHCGVSVRMNYSPNGSGAYSWRAANSLKSYFKYSSNLLLTSKGSYTETNWAKLLMAEIDEGRPMYYQGYGSGGHAFNVDGYQGTDYFHFNWGWGGSYNGYFYLNDLTPGSHSYTNSQGAIIGAIDRDLYSGLDCSSPIVLTPNVPYVGATTASQNIVNRYGNCYYYSTGKEVVHQITTTFPGRIRASLTNLNDSILDVFILSHCNQDSLLAYGDTTAFADNTEPGTYFIVVDGRYAYEGSYTLTVTVPSSDPDLIITNQSVVPNKIEAGGIGQISFIVKNIGNNSASASKTNIYYSEDTNFDGSDILIEQINTSSLNTDSEIQINQSITIPAGAPAGMRYILFVADAENDVIETDEIYNTESYSFEVPPAGIMDCSSSISLSDNIWYFGNTENDGVSNIENYPCAMPLPGKEIIHSITATNNGVATFMFSEKNSGKMYLLPMTSCNENTCINSFAIWNPEDTLITESIQVFAGVTYFFVVDGEDGVSGEYALKIKMPEACPEPVVRWWGDLSICESEHAGVSLQTSWLYNDIQWYRNNVLLPDETASGIWATQSGEYKVEVVENGCSGFSEIVEVTISPVPTQADITANGDTTFCEGNNVMLNLATGVGYTIQWMKNNNPIEGETGISILTEETGLYTAEVTNIGCSINSNTKQVTVNPVTANIGEYARVNSKDLVSWFSCNINDNNDLSGTGNDINLGSWDFPEDRNGNWNKAIYYNGQWENGTTINSFDNPNVLTLSLWIKTNTAEGGMILGLGDNQYGASTLCDRMIYMDDAGRLYFGLLDGTAKTISTSESYNDNNWHLITTSLSESGTQLYIDGELKSEDISVTSGADYIGWWKIAYDEIDAAFPNIPTNMYYKGVVDEIKIYERKLLSDEVRYLFEENNVFTASAEQSNFCESGETNIILNNSENFIEYQLRNNLDNSLVGSSVTGNANTINLPTGSLTETTTFNILATNPESGCSFELSDLFTVNINALPTSTISGGATICAGETTNISISLTGVAPWSLTYTDGTNSFNETTSDNSYVFAVTNAGTYEVTNLSDVNCTGTSFGEEATIIVNNLPTSTISGDAEICAGNQTNIAISLTGTAPWSLTYTDGTNSFNETTSDNSYVFAVTNAGTYEVTNLSDVNCTGTNFNGSANIIVNSLPNIDLGNDVNITTNESIILDAGAGFTSYLWTDGSDQQTLNLQGASLGIGNWVYSVLVEDGNTCENSDTIIINVTQGIDIKYIDNSKIKIYPNPTQGIVSINFKDLIFSDAKLKITSINGKQILKTNILQNTIEVDMSKFGNGIYFIEVVIDNKTYHQKLIVY